MAATNLWPTQITADSGLEGPLLVLKEQAALLGQATKNLVEAEIESGSNDSSNNLVDRFVIYSSLINYRYVLFYVEYPSGLYPAFVVWDGFTREGVKEGSLSGCLVHSREELESTLQEIFSHERTVGLIQALIARARI